LQPWVPYICLNEDEMVSDDAGVTFDVDNVVAFPCNLAVAKRGIRWSPTRMTVSDLQSDLHLQSIPAVLDSHACYFILFHIKLKQSLDPIPYKIVTPPVLYISIGFISFIYT
jgi:hypothetical protein